MIEKYRIKNTKVEDKDEFVSTIFMDKRYKPFIFIRKNNQKLDSGKKDLISGHIKDNGELPIQAMYREAREEIGIKPEEILQFHSLGEIKLPHPLLKNKKCNIYGAIIDYTLEQLNENIKIKSTEKELDEAKQLEDLNELESDIKEGENWRIFWTPELGEKINMLKLLIRECKEQQKGLEI